MIEYLNYLTIFFCIIFLYKYFVLKIQLKSIINSKSLDHIKNFTAYVTILEYFMDKAYNVIYKDRIIVYSSEGYRINNSEFNTITKDFIGLVIKLMGPRFKEEFCTFYGGEEVFYFNLSDYFNSRFEDDGIRKSAIENFINKDVEEQLTGEKQ